MLARMIRRVTDEEGVKKLVFETFTTLWFQPVDTRIYTNAVATKVTTMCSVAQHCIKVCTENVTEKRALKLKIQKYQIFCSEKWKILDFVCWKVENSRVLGLKNG